MGFSAVLLGLSALQAVSQIQQGKAENREAEVNAKIIEGKKGLIDIRKAIQFGQEQRSKGQVLSQSMARTGAAGIKPTGSAMAVMLDTQRQMSLDQAIGQFNFDQEKRYIQAEADAVRRGGKAAIRRGYSNAFSTLLKGATQYGMRKAMFRGGNKTTQLTQQGTIKDTTFDSVAPYQSIIGSVR